MLWQPLSPPTLYLAFSPKDPTLFGRLSQRQQPIFSGKKPLLTARISAAAGLACRHALGPFASGFTRGSLWPAIRRKTFIRTKEAFYLLEQRSINDNKYYPACRTSIRGTTYEYSRNQKILLMQYSPTSMGNSDSRLPPSGEPNSPAAFMCNYNSPGTLIAFSALHRVSWPQFL
jgi:hypothetical protein